MADSFDVDEFEDDKKIGRLYPYLTPFPSLKKKYLEHAPSPRTDREVKLTSPISDESAMKVYDFERRISPFMGAGFQAGVHLPYLAPKGAEANVKGQAMPEQKKGIVTAERPEYKRSGDSAPRKQLGPENVAEKEPVKTLVVLKPAQVPTKGMGGSTLPADISYKDHRPRATVTTTDPKLVDPKSLGAVVSDNYASEKAGEISEREMAENKAWYDAHVEEAKKNQAAQFAKREVSLPPPVASTTGARAAQAASMLGGLPALLGALAWRKKAQSEGR